jgi:RimJ/RimL family protein N-acetyltransferase
VLFTSARLRARHFVDADAPMLRALNDSEHVRRYVGDGVVVDDDAALTILRTRMYPQMRDHGVGRWAIELLASGAFIGWCGLRFDGDTATYDLGYRFFEEHWGRGYATEAALATMAWARANLPPSARIVGRAHVENRASIRVLEKCGLAFQRELVEDGERIATFG